MEELERLWDVNPRTSGMRPTAMTSLEEEALEIVTKHWMEQGIRNNKWGYKAHGMWKHEESPELDSQLETDSEVESPPCLISFFP